MLCHVTSRHARTRQLRGMQQPGTARAASVCVVQEVVRVLRGYWSAVFLGLAAAVLLALGAPAKAALAGAGFAFIGAAVTRGIDIANQRRAEAAQAEASRRRDLDETRRLAYAALVTAHSGEGVRDATLIATLVNALGHHGLGVDPDEATDRLLNFDQRWLQEQIGRITDELGT